MTARFDHHVSESSDRLKIYDLELTSRLLLGTAGYPSPQSLKQSIEKSQTQMVTVSLRREMGAAGQDFWTLIQETGVKILPNTAGCHSVVEAITTAQMAREVFATNVIKLEIIGHDDSLQPDCFALVEATIELIKDGFQVLPYMNDDVVVAEKLAEAGCKVLMPWGAPIGSAQGLKNPDALKMIRHHFPDITLIIDAGIGRPSHALSAMEIGYDAVLLNTAVAKSGQPPLMAKAFADAVYAGRMAYAAQPLEPRNMAVPSTPVFGKAFS
jgi:thiazole synthase